MKNIEKVATVPKTVESANVESNNVNFEGAKLQKELQKMLNKLNEKKVLADNREIFLNTKEKLQQFIGAIKEQGFESKQGRVILKMTTDGYRETDVLSISNPDLLLKFAEIIQKEIDLKISEIEMQLLNN